MNLFVTIGGILYNVVIIAVCTVVILIKRKKQKGFEEDFLFGGKKMGWFACAASMALTGIGGAHINGLPAQAWDTGVATISFCLGMGCFFLIVMRYTGVWYRRMGCSTINEMFGKMFHPALVPILAGLGVSYCWMVLCVETQGMATVISSMTGLSNFSGGLIGAAIGILYVFLAGIEEVGWVNSVNAILMYLFGIIALIFVGYSFVGGWTAVNDNLLANNQELVHALGNPTIVRTYVIGTFVSTALGMNFVQGDIQASASVSNVKVLRKACAAAIPMNILFGVIIISLGLAAKSLVNSGLMVAEDGAEGVVVLVLNYMPSWLQIGVIGMFLAAMLSTFAMLALSIAVMINRNILSYFPSFKNMSLKKEGFLSRIWILLAAATAAFAAIAIKAQTNIALTWGMAWFIPLFFLFVIGMHWRRSRKGALAALILCWVFNCLLTFTPLDLMLNLEGSNHSIFMVVLSVVFGLIFTALDKNCAISYRKLYSIQRAEYDGLKNAK